MLTRAVPASDKPDIPYDGEQLCADMLCILDELGVDSVDVVGISFGGMIAQEMALRAPQRLRSQLLVSSYRASDAWTDRMWQVRLQLLHELGMAAHFQLALMFLFSPHSFRADAATVAKLEAAFTQSPPDPVGYTRQQILPRP
ncbi:MAG: alpha/beta fold hydrolase [Gammaproteobacteria bacterium]